MKWSVISKYVEVMLLAERDNTTAISILKKMQHSVKFKNLPVKGLTATLNDMSLKYH